MQWSLDRFARFLNIDIYVGVRQGCIFQSVLMLYHVARTDGALVTWQVSGIVCQDYYIFDVPVVTSFCKPLANIIFGPANCKIKVKRQRKTQYSR